MLNIAYKFSYFSLVDSKLLHPSPTIILGQGYAIPPYIHRRGAAAVPSVNRPRPIKVVKTISQFDEPDGWKPVVVRLFASMTRSEIYGTRLKIIHSNLYHARYSK